MMKYLDGFIMNIYSFNDEKNKGKHFSLNIVYITQRK